MGDDVSSFRRKYYLEWHSTFIESQESPLITYHTCLALCWHLWFYSNNVSTITTHKFLSRWWASEKPTPPSNRALLYFLRSSHSTLYVDYCDITSGFQSYKILKWLATIFQNWLLTKANNISMKLNISVGSAL